MASKIGVAIIGSGIFVKEEHLPAVQKCETLQLKAIYSRSLQSAKSVVESVTTGDGPIDVYSDDEPTGQNYTKLLQREDISGVIIALPILVQPQFIKQALLAGKHVLAEKPLAKDVATARDLLDWYHANIDTTRVTLGIAEQFRYVDSFVNGSRGIAQMGRILGCRLRMHMLVQPGTKYFETAWRKTPEYQGGFLLDGGVHFIAGMRLLLGGGDVKLQRVSAYTSQLQKHLPPVDTVDAIFMLDNGSTGTCSISFGTSFTGSEYSVACEEGVVSIFPDKIVTTKIGNKQAGEEQRNPDESSYVPREVEAWAASLISGQQEAQQRPEEALADLEVLEAMLWSGDNDGASKDLHLQT